MNFRQGGGGTLSQNLSQERVSKKHVLQLLKKRTTFFKSFSIMDAFHIKNIANGFTLAEVLITLGIIGVVAAMTLPALVNRTQGKELEAKLQKTYSVLQQAKQRMDLDYGMTVTPQTHNTTTKFLPEFAKYFSKYVNCGENKCDVFERDSEGKLTSKHYKAYNMKTIANADWFDNGLYMMTDGMFLMSNDAYGSYGIVLTVDINGINKKPDAWGHDVFTFNIRNDGKVLPMGADGTLYPLSEYPDYCSPTSTNTYNGISCAYKALTDKDYFKNLPK